MHPFFISFSLIVNGGDILRAFFFQSNLNNKTPFSRHASIILSTISEFLTIAANIKPIPVNSIISGCFNSFLKRVSFVLIWLINFESLNTLRVASAADAITGLPPKVVM